MSLAPQTQFNRSANVIDPTQGAQRALGNMGTLLNQYVQRGQFDEKMAEDKRQADLLQAYRNRQAELAESAESRAGDKWARELAEKKAQDTVLSLNMRPGVTKTLAEKGKTTVLPGKEGVVTPGMLDKSKDIGALSDELLKVNKALDKPAVGGKTKVVPYIPQHWDSRSLPERAGYMLDEKGNVLDKATLKTKRDKLLEDIDFQTEKFKAEYKQGETAPEVKTTEDTYKYTVPKLGAFTKTLTDALQKQVGDRPLTEIEKGAIGKRALALFKDAENTAYKENLLQAQYKGSPKESTLEKERAKLQAKKEYGLLDTESKKKDYTNTMKLLEPLSRSGWFMDSQKELGKANVAKAIREGYKPKEIEAAIMSAKDPGFLFYGDSFDETMFAELLNAQRK